MDLSHQKFLSKDFRNQDLRNVPMHHSEFVLCKFDNANMQDVDASYSLFSGGSMRGTNCNGTNFMKSELNLFFEPSDAMGMTLSLQCSTFKGMTISAIWWYGWLYFAYQMKPGLENPEELRDKLKQFIGNDRFQRLDNIFRRRRL